MSRIYDQFELWTPHEATSDRSGPRAKISYDTRERIQARPRDLPRVFLVVVEHEVAFDRVFARPAQQCIRLPLTPALVGLLVLKPQLVKAMLADISQHLFFGADRAEFLERVQHHHKLLSAATEKIELTDEHLDDV